MPSPPGALKGLKVRIAQSTLLGVKILVASPFVLEDGGCSILPSPI